MFKVVGLCQWNILKSTFRTTTQKSATSRFQIEWWNFHFELRVQLNYVYVLNMNNLGWKMRLICVNTYIVTYLWCTYNDDQDDWLFFRLLPTTQLASTDKKQYPPYAAQVNDLCMERGTVLQHQAGCQELVLAIGWHPRRGLLPQYFIVSLISTQNWKKQTRFEQKV